MSTFRPDEHVRRRVEFEAAYESGAKVSGRLMTMFVRQNAGGRPRLGIAATRKIGGAVIRNRAKRLAREVFRTHKPAAPLDIIVVPRREFLDAPYPTVEHEFAVLLERAGRAPAGRRDRAAAGRRGPRGARSHSRV